MESGIMNIYQAINLFILKTKTKESNSSIIYLDLLLFLLNFYQNSETIEL
jgi:hypothetical protein